MLLVKVVSVGGTFWILVPCMRKRLLYAFNLTSASRCDSFGRANPKTRFLALIIRSTYLVEPYFFFYVFGRAHCLALIPINVREVKDEAVSANLDFLIEEHIIAGNFGDFLHAVVSQHSRIVFRYENESK